MRIEKGEKIALVIIGTLLIILGSGKFIYQPKHKELGLIKKEIRELEHRIQKVREETGNLRVLEKEEKSVQEELTYLKAKFPTEKQIPQVVQQLAEEGEKYHIDFIAIRPQTPAPPPEPQAIYIELPIKMNIRGRYQDLGEYLEKIRNLPRLITIDRILIRRKSEILPVLETELFVTAYLLKE